MKSCSEMTSSVFARIEEYQRAKKRRNKLIAKSIIPVLGICLGVLIAIAAQPQKELKFAENTPNPEIEEYISKEENIIIVNEIDGISADRAYICLLWEDFVPMTPSEMNDYYGTNVFPSVPEDLKSWAELENEHENYGIYRRNGGMGEVYHDGIVLNYSNEDFSRSINVELAKGGYPISCYGDFERYCEMSVISGNEVGIGQSDAGYYVVEFMYKDVGFRMIIEGLSIEEIESVIESLVGHTMTPSDEEAVTEGD